MLAAVRPTDHGQEEEEAQETEDRDERIFGESGGATDTENRPAVEDNFNDFKQ